jgi:predicted solute-binding protein
MPKQYHQGEEERNKKLNTYTTEDVIDELKKLQIKVSGHNLNNYHDVLRYLLDREDNSDLEVEEELYSV